MRARYACLVAAAAAAPLCAGACELIAGVHDVSYTGGAGGAGSPDAGEDASADADAGADADADVAADASLCFPPASDAGMVGSPLTPIPEGYGPYCSLLDPATHTWSFYWTHSIGALDGGLPCVLGQKAYPGSVIVRAGLHAADTDAGVVDNVLAQCGADVTLYQGPGSIPLSAAHLHSFDAGLNGCVFTVAPVSLPVFSRPYGPLPGGGVPTVLGAFDFDLLQAPLAVGAFGQAASPPGTTACAVDREGREACYFGTPAACEEAGAACSISACQEEDAGCMISEGTPLGFGYAWGMPEGTPLLAVAGGVVRGALARDVPGCGDPQQEIYIEHAVGSGVSGAEPYTERFIAGYLGLSTQEVAVGQVVTQGQEIGLSGSTGCQPAALRFVVLRLTNLTGAASYTFEVEGEGPYGFNGIQGAIDPFGWAAPAGVDPWAHVFIGAASPPGSPCGYGSPGAFSIDLWLPGAAPPTLP